MLRLPLFLGLVALCSLEGAQYAFAQQESRAIAVVEGETLSLDYFQPRYAQYLLRTGQTDSPRLRMMILNEILGDRLLIREARQNGIEQTSGFRTEADIARRKILLDLYDAYVVGEQVQVTDADRAEIFARMNGMVQARHLYSRTQAGAEALYQRLQAGETFESLAREVFADTALANSGGLLPAFTFDEMDPAFEDAAFTLPVGAISRPIRTAQGFSVMQVVDRFVSPILTESAFAERRAFVDGYVYRKKRTQARNAYAQSRLDQLQATFHAEGIDALIGRASGARLVQEETPSRPIDSAPVMTFSHNGTPITWTVSDVDRQLMYVAERTQQRVQSQVELESLLRGMAVQEQLARDAEERGLDAHPDYSAMFTNAMETWISDTRRREIRESVVVAEDTLRALFAAYPADFWHPARVFVEEIVVPSRATADSLLALLATQDFGDLAARYSIRPGASEARGRLGFVSQQEMGLLGERIFAAAEGDVLGPIEVQGFYTLLRIGPAMDGRPMTFDEARPGLLEHQRWHQGQAAVQTHLEHLRRGADYRVDGQVVMTFALDGAPQS